jgi:hypothetical protein
MGGAATMTNGTHFMTNNYDSRFSGGTGKSFTMAVWLIGANANNSYIANGDISTSDWELDGTMNWNVVRADGTTVTIVNGAFDPSKFHLYVCGFDSANKRSFFSMDGAPMTTASTSGQDLRNSTLGLKFAWINGSCDEFYWWTRALSDAEIAQLANVTNGAAFGLKYPYANDIAKNLESGYGWAVTNAGAYVSLNSSNAVYKFDRAIIAAGIYTNLIGVFTYNPDSFKAAVIPSQTIYFQGGGNDIHYAMFDGTYLTSGFSDADLSLNGLKGTYTGASAPTKYFYTGPLPAASSIWQSMNDAGFRSTVIPPALSLRRTSWECTMMACPPSGWRSSGSTRVDSRLQMLRWGLSGTTAHTWLPILRLRASTALTATPQRHQPCFLAIALSLLGHMRLPTSVIQTRHSGASVRSFMERRLSRLINFGAPPM